MKPAPPVTRMGAFNDICIHLSCRTKASNGLFLRLSCVRARFSQHFDCGGAESQLRKHLSPIEHVPQRSGPQGLIRYNNCVTRIQSKLVERVIAPQTVASVACSTYHRPICANYKRVTPVRISIWSASQSQI